MPFTHKYHDDMTITEVVTKGSASELQRTVDGLDEWSERNKIWTLIVRKQRSWCLGHQAKTQRPCFSYQVNLSSGSPSTIYWVWRWTQLSSSTTTLLPSCQKLESDSGFLRNWTVPESPGMILNTSSRLSFDQSWSTRVRLGTAASINSRQSCLKTQRHSLQVIVGNIPYEESCSGLNLASLADRRLSLCRTLLCPCT